GEKFILNDPERAQIIADFGHHHVDGALAHDREPFRLRSILQRWSVRLREILANRLEISAEIDAFLDGDVFPERLAVAQIWRACEYVDLRAGIVGLGVARDVVAGKGK